MGSNRQLVPPNAPLIDSKPSIITSSNLDKHP
jgi:hypothetical protein